jgi:hypothetical protein
LAGGIANRARAKTSSYSANTGSETQSRITPVDSQVEHGFRQTTRLERRRDHDIGVEKRESSARLLLAEVALAPGGGDLCVNVVHCELVEALGARRVPVGLLVNPGAGARVNEHSRLREPAVLITVALHQKPLVAIDRAVENLAELGSSGNGGDFSGHDITLID